MNTVIKKKTTAFKRQIRKNDLVNTQRKRPTIDIVRLKRRLKYWSIQQQRKQNGAQNMTFLALIPFVVFVLYVILH